MPDADSERRQTVVMKFGGTSVASAERIKHAAQRIVQSKEAGSRVVAVLSARGTTTNELMAMAAEVSPRPDPRELDMLLSTGERISCALVAMAIHDLGYEAVSFTGSQAGIVTDDAHGRAKIREIRAQRVVCLLYTSDAADDSLRVDLAHVRTERRRERHRRRVRAAAAERRHVA